MEAVRQMARYLKGTKDTGIILQPKGSQGFECWVDADFAGGFTSTTTHKDPTTSKS